MDAWHAYLAIRDHGATTIEQALELLAPAGTVRERFDAIADGLALRHRELADQHSRAQLERAMTAAAPIVRDGP